MLEAGTIISGRYEIKDTVGSGGMSTVYRAIDRRLNRYVAIKVLKEEFSNDKTFVNKFRVEAQSAAGLSHPNIVNVYDVGDDNGIHYIVMELVDGITLKEYIHKKGHLSVSEAVNISLQIASGMEVAHENHIIHRDIKPQNIIISNSGIVKVTDFGIAKAATSATISASAIGSVHYISPEQAKGNYCDERSDIYSLGITMYEMVTGHVPFDGDSNVAVALMHIQDEMIPPHEYYPDILPSFEKVIEKCTQKKPERRYLTANALIADLRRVESDPSGSFVHINSIPDDGPTRVMSEEEQSELKKRMSEPKPDDNAEQGKLVPAEDGGKTDKKKGKKGRDTGDSGDDEDEEMDPKLEKLAKILGVVVAAIVILLILLLVASITGVFGGKKNKKPKVSADATTEVVSEDAVEVPDVVGSDKDEAQTALENAGFTNVKVEYQESSDVDEDKVISQDPEAGESVPKDQEIRLLVSSGADKVTVPDVTGLDQDNAASKLEGEGFVVKRSYDYDDNVAAGSVIKQDPGANAQADKGAQVTIVISNGKETKEVTMESLIGLSLEDAEAKLKKLGLKYSVNKAYSDTYEKGEVISQSYNAGTVLTEGTTVNIVVSRGPEAAATTQAQTYTKQVNIANPLQEGVDSAKMEVIFTFGGSQTTLFTGMVTQDYFPLPVTCQTTSKGTGTVTVYLDGTAVSNYTVTMGS